MEFQLKIAAGNDDFNDLRDENGFLSTKPRFLKLYFPKTPQKSC